MRITVIRGPACLNCRSLTALTPTETTRARLLVQAARLFRNHGYAGTSTRALSDSLGLTKAALYHHVDSKDALLLELCVESLTRIDAAVTVALEGLTDSMARLQAAVIAHVASALENADMHATMLIEMRALSPESHAVVRRARAEYETRIRRLVEAAQEDRRLRASLDAKWMTLSLLNTLNWSIFWYHPDGDLAPEQIGRVLLDVYLNGVAEGPQSPVRGQETHLPIAGASQLDRVEAKLDALLAARPPLHSAS